MEEWVVVVGGGDIMVVGGGSEIMADRGWWWQNYGWSWVVVVGRNWSWMVVAALFQLFFELTNSFMV